LAVTTVEALSAAFCGLYGSLGKRSFTKGGRSCRKSKTPNGTGAGLYRFVGNRIGQAEYPLENFDNPAVAVGALGTDSIFACPARSADQVLSTQVPIFTYEFNDRNAPEIFLPPVGFSYGAAHASELEYLFELPQSVVLSPGQTELSENMILYWTQFAKSGNPNAQGVPFWPRYNNIMDKFQSLVPPSPMAEFGFATDHECDFWAWLFAARAGNK
jgi:carboxylesterase type B